MSKPAKEPAKAPPAARAPPGLPSRMEVAPADARDDALRASEQRYREVVESLNDVLYTLDAHGVILAANQAIERLFGVTPAEAFGRSLLDFVHPDDVGGVLERLASRRAGGPARLLDEVRGRRKDGSTFWMEVNSLAVQRDGAVIAFMGSIRDISRRKAAEEALAASEARYRHLVEDAVDVIYTHDLAGRFLDINRAAVQAFGFTQEELRAMTIVDLLHPDDRAKALAAQQAKAGGQVDRTGPYEVRTVAKDGRTVWMEVTTRILRDAGKPRILGIARDITARKAAQETLGVLSGLVADLQRRTTLDDALRGLLERLAASGGWAYSEAWVPAPDGRSLVPSPAWTGAGAAIQRFRKLSEKVAYARGEGLIGQAWVTCKSAWVPDMQTLPNIVRAASARAAGLASVALVPVLDGETVIAVLAFFAAKGRPDDLAWMQLAEQAAASAGLALSRLQAQGRAAHLQRLLEAQVGASPAGVLMVDANGGLVATNALFARLCGTDLKDGALASSDLGGRVAASTAAPDRFVERARDLYMGRGDLRIDAHWYSRQVLDLRGESGENLGKLVVLRDVTELQELRARLHAEKARQP